MNHTTNYSLNQWEADDRIQRVDFNADNAKLDAALGEKIRLVTGSYRGTDKYGPRNPNILEFPDAERPPRVVMLSNEGGEHQVVLIRGITRCFILKVLDKRHIIEITWTDKGVRWYCAEGSSAQFNSNLMYYYAVFI